MVSQVSLGKAAEAEVVVVGALAVLEVEEDPAVSNEKAEAQDRILAVVDLAAQTDIHGCLSLTILTTMVLEMW